LKEEQDNLSEECYELHGILVQKLNSDSANGYFTLSDGVLKWRSPDHDVRNNHSNYFHTHAPAATELVKHSNTTVNGVKK
jgi:hypothetical protein